MPKGKIGLLPATTHDIAKTLKSLGFDPSPSILDELSHEPTLVDALKEPTSQLLKTIVSHIWNLMSQKPYYEVENLLGCGTMPHSDTVDFEPEMRNSILFCIQFGLYQDVLMGLGVEDIKLTDVAHPDPERCRWHLSVLLNFICFYNDVKNERVAEEKKYEPMDAKLLSTIKEREEAQQQYEGLKRQLDDLVEDSDTVMQELVALQAQKQQLASEISSTKKEEEEFMLEMPIAQRRIQDLKDEIQECDMIVREEKTWILKHCETELERELQTTSRQIEETKNKITELGKQREDMVVKIERHREEIQEMECLNQLLTEDAELDDQIADCVDQTRTLDTEIADYSTQIRNVQCKKEKTVQAKRDLENDIAQRKVEHQLEKERLEEKTRRIEREERETEETKKENAKLEDELKTKKLEADQRKHQLKDMVNESEDAMNSYEQYILDSVAKVNQAVESRK